MRTLYDLLMPMQDINVEVHIFKNFSYKTDKDGNVLPVEEIMEVQGRCNDVCIKFMSEKYEIDWHNTNVFYIGFASNRSKKIKINCEFFDKEE